MYHRNKELFVWHSELKYSQSSMSISTIRVCDLNILAELLVRIAYGNSGKLSIIRYIGYLLLWEIWSIIRFESN